MGSRPKYSPTPPISVLTVVPHTVISRTNIWCWCHPTCMCPALKLLVSDTPDHRLWTSKMPPRWDAQVTTGQHNGGRSIGLVSSLAAEWTWDGHYSPGEHHLYLPGSEVTN